MDGIRLKERRNSSGGHAISTGLSGWQHGRIATLRLEVCAYGAFVYAEKRHFRESSRLRLLSLTTDVV